MRNHRIITGNVVQGRIEPDHSVSHMQSFTHVVYHTHGCFWPTNGSMVAYLARFPTITQVKHASQNRLATTVADAACMGDDAVLVGVHPPAAAMRIHRDVTPCVHGGVASVEPASFRLRTTCTCLFDAVYLLPVIGS